MSSRKSGFRFFLGLASGIDSLVIIIVVITRFTFEICRAFIVVRSPLEISAFIAAALCLTT